MRPRTSSGNKDTATPRVNLFGFDSHEKFPEGGLKEITRLLKLCGIEVHTAVGINCPVSDFRTIGEADANIILCPERCKKTAEYLRTHFNAPVYETGGMPIGFDLTEKFVREISELLGTDCTAALDDIEENRAGLSTTLHIAWEAAVSPKIFVMQQKENLLSSVGM